MHPAMIREIEEAVKSVGVEYMTIPSGAGHDAMHLGGGSSDGNDLYSMP